MKAKIRIGLDMGSTSIGWSVYKIESGEKSLLEGNSLLFQSGRVAKTNESLASARRNARSQRIMRERKKRRLAKLDELLKKYCMRSNKPLNIRKDKNMDPVEIRKRGLDEKLTLPEISRALHHIAKRRGFQSNRKTERGENESGKIRESAKNLKSMMENASARTYGEFLYNRREEDIKARNRAQEKHGMVNRPFRIRQLPDKDGKPKEGYEFYPLRKDYEDEFEILMKKQQEYHGILTDEVIKKLYRVIFHQRPLRPQKVGKCTITQDQPRVHRANPFYQRFVILQKVNSLKVVSFDHESKPLGIEERNKIVEFLNNKSFKSASSLQVSFKSIYKHLGWENGEKFTEDTEWSDKIKCDATLAILSHKELFGKNWFRFSLEEQQAIVQTILDIGNENDFEDKVQYFCTEYGLERQNAEKIADSGKKLPNGYGPVCLEVAQKVLEKLEEDVITYDKAISLANPDWHHSNFEHEQFERLPYYGRVLVRRVVGGTYAKDDDDIKCFGRISNPTVHNALNQLRKLVNELLDRYGHIDECVIEYARDLPMSKDDLSKYRSQLNRNQQDRKNRNEEIESLGGNIRSYDDHMKMRLFQEQEMHHNKVICVYSGETISKSKLFDGSVEIDHILPRSKTFDDSQGNKILCLQEYNRMKKDNTPYEFWAKKHPTKWEDIKKNITVLPKAKQNKFLANALEKYTEDNDFTARALNDTRYMARIACEYIGSVIPKSKVWTVRGGITSILRKAWGIGGKNRDDHRHHAEDAMIIGAVDKLLLEKISRYLKLYEMKQTDSWICKIPEPFENFNERIREILDCSTLVVSHKSDNGTFGKSTTGPLHDDTIFGFDRVKEGQIDPATGIVRKSLTDNWFSKDFDIDLIVSDQIRHELLVLAKKIGNNKEALNEWKRLNPEVRRMRVRAQTTQNRVPHKNKEGVEIGVHRANGNQCLEFWQWPDNTEKPDELPDGFFEIKTRDNLYFRIITRFDANTNANKKDSDRNKLHSAAKILERLHGGDMVALGEGKGRKFYRLQKMTSGVDGSMVFLKEHNDARNTKDKKNGRSFSISSVVTQGIRRVKITPAGKILDRGAHMQQ